MACGRWWCERAIVAQAISGTFASKGSEPPLNPFEHRVEREKTPEELAELEAAKDRIERIRERVNQRRLQREAERDGGNFNDEVERLEAALKYVKVHQQPN